MTNLVSPREPSREWRLTWLAYAAMLVLGLNVSWLGPFLPQIAQSIHQPLDRVGLIFSAIAAGYFLALPLSGELGHRRGPHFLLIMAVLFDAAGVLGLAIAPALPASLGAAGAIGFAHCGIDIATNALVAELNRDRLAAALNYLHVMFGVGATFGPAIDGLAMSNRIGYATVFGGGAVVAAILAAGLILSPRSRLERETVDVEPFRSLLKRPLIWIIAIVLFLYVGAEVGIGGWLFTYLRSGAGGVSRAVASTIVSIYWAGLIGGRLLGARLSARISTRRLAMIGSIVSTIAMASLIFTLPIPMLAFPTVALIGLGFGPVFPNMIAAGAERFPSRVASMTSIVAAGAAAGGVLLPWAMGIALVIHGSTFSIAIPLAATLAMLAILAALDRASGNL